MEQKAVKKRSDVKRQNVKICLSLQRNVTMAAFHKKIGNLIYDNKVFL